LYAPDGRFGQDPIAARDALIRHRMTAAVNGDNQASGGSFKFIADTEDWDNSVGLNNPGQSGDPESPHYRDLFDFGRRAATFPSRTRGATWSRSRNA
jgi:hypothetical protein